MRAHLEGSTTGDEWDPFKKSHDFFFLWTRARVRTLALIDSARSRWILLPSLRLAPARSLTSQVCAQGCGRGAAWKNGSLLDLLGAPASPSSSHRYVLPGLEKLSG